jgi:hypothetical protein
MEAQKEKLIGYWDEVRIIDSTEESAKQLLMLLMNSHDKILSHHADSSCVAKSIDVIAADRQERLTLDTSGSANLTMK